MKKKFWLGLFLVAIIIASGCTTQPPKPLTAPSGQLACYSDVNCAAGQRCIDGNCVNVKKPTDNVKLAHYIDLAAEELDKNKDFFNGKRVCVFAEKYKLSCTRPLLGKNVFFEQNPALEAVSLLGNITELKNFEECPHGDYNNVLACGLFSRDILLRDIDVTRTGGGYDYSVLIGDILIEAGGLKPEKIVANDLAGCNSFSSAIRKDICVFDFVVNLRKSDDCGQISSKIVRSSCNWNLALKKNDSLLCEKIDFSDLNNEYYKNAKDDCLEKFISTDAAYCDKFELDSYKQDCLEKVSESISYKTAWEAAKALNPNLCRNLGGSTKTEDCLSLLVLITGKTYFCIDQNKVITSECIRRRKNNCNMGSFSRCLTIDCSNDRDCEDFDSCTKDECVKNVYSNSATGICKNAPIADCSYGSWDDFSTPEKAWQIYINGLKEKNKEKVQSSLTAYSKQQRLTHDDVSKYESVLAFVGNINFKPDVNGSNGFLWPDPPTQKFGPVFIVKENDRWKIELALVNNLVVYDTQNNWQWKYYDMRENWLKQG